MEDNLRDKSNIEWFSQAPGFYEEVYDSSLSVGYFLNQRVAKVKQLLDASGGNLLDVGCGIGMLFRRLAPENFQFFGIDISPRMLAYCKNGAGTVKPLYLAQSNLEHLPFTNESFDVVVGLGVLEYLPQVRVGIEEIARVTKPDGTVILSMHNKWSPYRWWERCIYSKAMEIASKLTSVRHRPQPTLRLHPARAIAQLMVNSGLKPVEIIYYDFNVFPPPLDQHYPRRALLVNTRLERLFGQSLSRLFATGFLVKARKVLPNTHIVALNGRKSVIARKRRDRVRTPALKAD
ncbi:MAG: class I SAM-dependent methyltransferase [Acidobacteria bacterium]|nr:class I SAM-dependent methyltransferase [Acidobacteriota bacterium]